MSKRQKNDTLNFSQALAPIRDLPGEVPSNLLESFPQAVGSDWCFLVSAGAGLVQISFAWFQPELVWFRLVVPGFSRRWSGLDWLFLVPAGAGLVQIDCSWVQAARVWFRLVISGFNKALHGFSYPPSELKPAKTSLDQTGAG